MAEMVDSWKKNHNMFGILYSWFLAKACSLISSFFCLSNLMSMRGFVYIGMNIITL